MPVSNVDEGNARAVVCAYPENLAFALDMDINCLDTAHAVSSAKAVLV